MNVIKIVKSYLHNIFTFYSRWACTWWFQLWCKTVSTLEFINLYIPHYDQPQNIHAFKTFKCYHFYYMFKWTTLHRFLNGNLSIFFVVNSTTRCHFSNDVPMVLLKLQHLSHRIFNAFQKTTDGFAMPPTLQPIGRFALQVSLSVGYLIVFPWLWHFSPSEGRRFKCRCVSDIQSFLQVFSDTLK